PRLIRRTVGTTAFPSLEWNDVPSDAAQVERFVVYAIGVPIGGNFYSNVWGHAADTRTALPQPLVPEPAVAELTPREGVDARIQIVWPHDEVGRFTPPDRAEQVNVSIDLF